MYLLDRCIKGRIHRWFAIGPGIGAPILLASILGISGCAGLPTDWGRSEVGHEIDQRGLSLPLVEDAQSFTAGLLAKPLSIDSAVQLALINNPEVRRETARLGFAAGEVYEAGRLANPLLSMTYLNADDDDAADDQLTLGIAINFVQLLFLPATKRFAAEQFAAAKLSVAANILDLASNVRHGWYEAVTLEHIAQVRELASTAQRASAQLAARFFAAGNINQQALAAENAAASQMVLAALRARGKATEGRLRLNRLMGLSASQDTWTLDARLAEPLPNEDDTASLQQLGFSNHLELLSLRKQAQALADRHGLMRQTRWIGDIEIGAERERDFDGSINLGPTLALTLPLFDWGEGRAAVAQAQLQQIEAELDARVLDVSNGIQLAAHQVKAAKAVVNEYRDGLIPQLEAVVARVQEEQNYMLVGVFEVIFAKQQEYDAYAGYVEAVGDYWIARSELSRAVGQDLPSDSQAKLLTIDPRELLRPKRGGMDHHHHPMGRDDSTVQATDHSQHSPQSANGNPKAHEDE